MDDSERVELEDRSISSKAIVVAAIVAIIAVCYCRRENYSCLKTKELFVLRLEVLWLTLGKIDVRVTNICEQQKFFEE
jgi:hypothetical protein